ncbi:MAG: hypothetical protein QOH06_4115 [Acidobacteriota bacterium]|nr:hypothetical protein [Acidobacteriota bacterium]
MADKTKDDSNKFEVEELDDQLEDVGGGAEASCSGCNSCSGCSGTGCAGCGAQPTQPGSY